MIRKLNRLLEPIGAASIIILLIASGVVTLGSLSRMWSDVAKVGDSYNVLESLDSVALALREAEAGQRGFLVSGDESYLEPYSKAEARLDGLLEQLKQRTSANRAQDELNESLRSAIRAKRDELALTIEVRREGSEIEAQNIVKTDVGIELMNQIETQIDSMRDNARTRHAIQIAETRGTYQTAWLTGLVLTLAGLALVGGVVWAVARERGSRARTANSTSESDSSSNRFRTTRSS